jgi:phage tail sheath protein FI
MRRYSGGDSMLQFKQPGVYTQELPSGVRTISPAPTSVALFVGPTKAGIDARPTRLLNFGDFERSFGGLSQTSSLSYSVLHFFANGGGEAWVHRVPAKNAKPAISAFKRDDGANNESLQVTALSSGTASNSLFVEFDAFGIGANALSGTADKKHFNLTITDQLTGRVERFGNLSTTSTDARFAPQVVNDPATGSKLVKVDVTGIDNEAPQANASYYSVGTLPTAAPGTFANDVSVQVSVDVLAADGSADAAASIANLAVTVFPNGSNRPASTLELVTRTVAALNAAIRADATAGPKMQGVAIEGAPFVEGANTYIRLRTAPPGPVMPSTRLIDATVRITDTGGAAATRLFSAYALNQVLANPSRYQLSAQYGAGGQVFGTPQAGTDGDAMGQPDSGDFKQAVMDLATPDAFFNILCLPDVVRPAANDPNALFHTSAMSIYSEAALVCQTKHAFLLIDPLPDVTTVGAAESWKTLRFTFQSSHAAAFFPNIRVDDPLVPGAIRSHPPSGALAGVFARTDARFGVWAAPAGTEAVLSSVYGPSTVLSDEEHGILNPLGVNCIRQFPIYGTVNFGSRTVDGSNALASEWKYIPVRRTASFILRSLSEALRWAVHKPNGEELWGELRMNVTAFMQGLFRQGAFKGTSARQAYFVLCDASTTTADDIDQGIVNIVIGFAPLKPAEFVVISLRQIVQPAA